MNKNGIGPQGLGKKEHNGFWIGSPAKQTREASKEKYKEITDKFPKFNSTTDTVTVNKGPNISVVMENTGYDSLKFKGKNPKETKYFKDPEGTFTSYSLREKQTTTPAKKLTDLSGDRKITQKDVLIAKGVLKAPKSPAKKTVKDACYRKVKATYDVFPSAYASGAIAKCRKNKK